jgi:hypothetical protein
MVRRLLYLGAALLLIVLAAPGCGGTPSSPNKGPTMSDPEGGAKPTPPRGS